MTLHGTAIYAYIGVVWGVNVGIYDKHVPIKEVFQDRRELRGFAHRKSSAHRSGRLEQRIGGVEGLNMFLWDDGFWLALVKPIIPQT